MIRDLDLEGAIVARATPVASVVHGIGGVACPSTLAAAVAGFWTTGVRSARDRFSRMHAMVARVRRSRSSSSSPRRTSSRPGSSDGGS